MPVPLLACWTLVTMAHTSYAILAFCTFNKTRKNLFSKTLSPISLRRKFKNCGSKLYSTKGACLSPTHLQGKKVIMFGKYLPILRISIILSSNKIKLRLRGGQVSGSKDLLFNQLFFTHELPLFTY